MISGLLLLIFGRKKFVPYSYNSSIYDIPYDKFYEEGYRYILSDLDNTLISYVEKMPNERLEKWRDHLLELGFKIMIVSNSHSNRVKEFANSFGVLCQYSSTKPLKRGFKKAIKRLEIADKGKVLVLGDQILTDILGANRMGFTPILVEAIDRSSEHKATRFNRFFERRIVKKIKKKDPNGVLKDYE